MDPCHICILPEPARPTVADAKLTLQAQAGMIGRGEEEVQSFVRGIIYMQRSLSGLDSGSLLTFSILHNFPYDIPPKQNQNIKKNPVSSDSFYVLDLS